MASCAPLVIDGAINGDLAYIGQMLAPILSPGDIVVLDTLSSHKVKGVRQHQGHRVAPNCICRPHSGSNSSRIAEMRLYA
jgi:hypothetical protein